MADKDGFQLSLYKHVEKKKKTMKKKEEKLRRIISATGEWWLSFHFYTTCYPKFTFENDESVVFLYGTYRVLMSNDLVGKDFL